MIKFLSHATYVNTNVALIFNWKNTRTKSTLGPLINWDTHVNHVALPVLTLSLCGNAALSEQMETLKKDFKESFMQLASDIQHNLEVIREESKGCSKITLDYICELSTKVESFLTNPSPPTAKVVPTKPSTVEEVPTPPSYSTPPSGCPPTQPSTAYQLKKKVLFVSDSVGPTVEFPYRKLLMGFRPEESEGILRNPDESKESTESTDCKSFPVATLILPTVQLGPRPSIQLLRSG